MILLLMYCLRAIAGDCNAHTKVFTERGGPSNTNNWYFDSRTYNIGGDACRTFTRNDKYKELVDATIPCVGEWCSQVGKWKNDWNCKNRGVSCYHVEHIIPKTSNVPGLLGCNMNIHGNVIMTYGRWNSALGSRFFAEKRLVYGDTIFKNAYVAIYKCCKGADPVTIPDLC